MRRRLTFAIIGTVLATLVVAGLGTLALAGIGARHQTQSELQDQAEATASILSIGREPVAVGEPRALPREQFNRVRNALEVDDLGLIVLNPSNEIALEVSDPLPDGLSLERLHPATLAAGEPVSGSIGDRVFAAAPLENDVRGFLGVVVLTRPVDRALGPAVGWFLLASTVTIAIGALVAYRVANKLTRPLRDATLATTQIAGGDLTVRLPEGEAKRDDEIVGLSRSINQMATALERSRGLEQQFLLSVSHDLRTPLTSIRGYAEAIADGNAPDDQAAALVILAESRRLERLVRDLLDLAKLDARQFTFHVVPVDLNAAVPLHVDGFAHEATELGVQVAVELAERPVVVAVDPDRLGQIVANLVENALKYAHNSVTVTTAGGSHPSLEVRDDGPGIAPEDLPHVFERLYVAQREPVRKESGSGLGLAIVRELVDAMGGHVQATDAPEGGTRIVVTFASPSAPTELA